ncbi:MAG: hypothetical protein IJ727_00695 [Treponema sp.]|nr:hypothetical protein [Treponema sp.]
MLFLVDRWESTMVVAISSLVVSVLLFVFIRRYKIPLQFRLLVIGVGILIGDFFILAHYYSNNANVGFDLFFMSLIGAAKTISLGIPYKDIMETLTFHGEIALKLLFCIFSILTPLLWCDFIMIVYSVVKSICNHSKK